MASFDDVCDIVRGWPGTEQGLWYGTDGIKVGGKGFCRLWSKREHDRDDVHDTPVLVVMCDSDEKQALIDEAQGVLFSTPHYEGHGGVLIRLADVELDALAGYLADSYRLKATKRLLAEFDTEAS